MHLDHSLLLVLAFNISMILALSWLGIKVINHKFSGTRLTDDRGSTRATAIVKEASFIIPRLKTFFIVRRRIKTDPEGDETPFVLPQFT